MMGEGLLACFPLIPSPLMGEGQGEGGQTRGTGRLSISLIVTAIGRRYSARRWASDLMFGGNMTERSAAW